MTAVYRTGRANRGIVYHQLGAEPHDDDPKVAVLDSQYVELAPLIVELLNAHIHWLTCGCTPSPTPKEPTHG